MGKDTDRGKRKREREGRTVCVSVFGSSLDFPLALSGAFAHSVWHPAYSAPHADPSKNSTQRTAAPHTK